MGEVRMEGKGRRVWWWRGDRFVGLRLGRVYLKARDLRRNPKLFSERERIRYRTLARIGCWELGVRWDAS